MEYTVDQYRQAARLAYEAGNIAAAEELAQAGLAAQRAATEGDVEFGAVRSMLKGMREGGEDIARTVTSEGLQLGAGIHDVMSAPGRAADFALAKGSQAIADLFGVEAPEFTQRPYEMTGGQPSTGRAMIEAGPITGPAMQYEAQTLPGDIAGTMVEMAPGAALPGSLLYNVAAPAVGQIAGERAAEALHFGETGQFVGGLLGSIAGPSALASGVRTLSPASGVPSDLRQVRADLLEEAMLQTRDGTGLSAGQFTGDAALRTVEGKLSASDEQLRAFTAAVVREMGGTPGGKLPDTIKSLRDNIGQMFDEVANNMPAINPYLTRGASGDTIVDRLRSTAETYGRSVGPGERVSVVDDVADWMERSLRTGKPIDGSEALRWRSELSEITATTTNEATAKATGAALRELDALMDTALRSTGRGDLVETLTSARRRWRDFLAFRSAASRAGEAPLEGAISPQALAQSIRGQDEVSYALGDRGAFGDLARAGEQILRSASAVSPGGVRQIPAVEATQAALTMATIGSGIGPTAAATGAVGARLFPGMRKGFVNDPLMQQYYRLGYLPTPDPLPLSTRMLTSGPLSILGQGD
tara:strand:+ start:752 stop:2512 length:1761 start_codon:yes stop_codon:yes gene_type:complete